MFPNKILMILSFIPKKLAILFEFLQIVNNISKTSNLLIRVSEFKSNSYHSKTICFFKLFFKKI